ncbi:ABC transporter substrate-binding protein [Kiloniella sp. b19]|uniref:ABC transporter substrate-binding protein n=1 Tax=Kiloniella sp. GXU_MW_B19 TaxID=3141326 RepID=UPI0031DD3BEA
MKTSVLPRMGQLLAGTSLGLMMTLGVAQADTIRFWTVEEQPDRLAKQQAMAEAFEKETGHSVEVIPVTEKDLGTRATAAFAAGDLPDVIYHSLQYALPWVEAGILDSELATEVVDELGAESFAQGALSMASVPDGYASVPVDGWTQMVVYRKDLFEAAGLEAPTNFANVVKAIEALHNPPELYGFVAATKVDEGFMSQSLEHLFLANGVSPVDENGVRKLDPVRAREVLDFYRTIVKASPPGELFWKQSRELYFAGKAAMIIWSPFILDELAGLRDSAPPTINNDPTSAELAGKTGFVTTFSGPSNPEGAAWAEMNYFGITSDANIEVAQQFVSYSMDQGYESTLSIAPEGKFPVRQGNAEEASKFVDLWAKLPVGVDRKAPLSSFYPADVIDGIVGGLNVAKRWGVEEGQLALASKIVNSQTINQIARQYADDQITADEAVRLIDEAVAGIQ